MTVLSGEQILESQRLLMRSIRHSDLGFFIDIHSDAEVTRYIRAGNQLQSSETQQWFNDNQDSHFAAALGQLTAVQKSDGARVGRCGLSNAVILPAVTSG